MTPLKAIVTTTPSQHVEAGRSVDPDDFRSSSFANADPSIPGPIAFQSPSGHIMCVGSPKTGSFPAFLHCQVDGATYPSTPKAAGRQFDWDGRLAVLTDSGPTMGLCTSQAPVPTGMNTLPYGSTIHIGELACRMDSAGLTCENASHRGWFISGDTFREFP